jgi:hypothetical protein
MLRIVSYKSRHVYMDPNESIYRMEYEPFDTIFTIFIIHLYFPINIVLKIMFVCNADGKYSNVLQVAKVL